MAKQPRRKRTKKEIEKGKQTLLGINLTAEDAWLKGALQEISKASGLSVSKLAVLALASSIKPLQKKFGGTLNVKI